MKEDFVQEFAGAWNFVKAKLHLPLPLKNHFYKGRRISIRRNWFCQDCHAIFHLPSREKHNREMATNIGCPNCGSRSVIWSTFLFMAIIDKKPKTYLLWLLEQTPEKIFNWISKRKPL